MSDHSIKTYYKNVATLHVMQMAIIFSAVITLNATREFNRSGDCFIRVTDLTG